MEFYEDMFWLMKTLFTENKTVRLSDLKRRYAEMGYEKRWNSIIPKELYEKLYVNFRKDLHIGDDGEIKTGVSEKWRQEIENDIRYRKFSSQYKYNPSKINQLALMAIWCIEQQ